jgi:hypothetical protein
MYNLRILYAVNGLTGLEQFAKHWAADETISLFITIELPGRCLIRKYTGYEVGLVSRKTIYFYCELGSVHLLSFSLFTISFPTYGSYSSIGLVSLSNQYQGIDCRNHA